jgi:ATP-binding cassette subfamily C (CFTR/MRP) protein 1
MSSNSTDFVEGLQSFGPSITGHFDFSPLFENSILSILPSALLYLVLPFRLWSLRKEPPKISKSSGVLYGNKLVRN